MREPGTPSAISLRIASLVAKASMPISRRLHGLLSPLITLPNDQVASHEAHHRESGGSEERNTRTATVTAIPTPTPRPAPIATPAPMLATATPTPAPSTTPTNTLNGKAATAQREIFVP